jgi:hypothetical protein
LSRLSDLVLVAERKLHSDHLKMAKDEMDVQINQLTEQRKKLMNVIKTEGRLPERLKEVLFKEVRGKIRL